MTRCIKKVIILTCLLILFSLSACTGHIQEESDKPHYSYITIRRKAVQTLGETKDPQAVESLIQALKDDAPSVRQAAAEALAKINDQQAVKPLLPLLGDKDEGVRRYAFWALGELNAKEVAKSYILNNNLVGEFWNMRKCFIGYKADIESIILAHIVGTLIEGQDDIIVIFKELKDSRELQQTLESGKIQLGIEYTGTAFFEILGKQGENDPQKIYEIAKEDYLKNFNLVWLKPFGCTSDKELSTEPDSYAAVISGKETLLKLPALSRLINKLTGKIDDLTMTKLIKQVDTEGKSAEEVAKKFLKEGDCDMLIVKEITSDKLCSDFSPFPLPAGEWRTSSWWKTGFNGCRGIRNTDLYLRSGLYSMASRNTPGSPA